MDLSLRIVPLANGGGILIGGLARGVQAMMVGQDVAASRSLSLLIDFVDGRIVEALK